MLTRVSSPNPKMNESMFGKICYSCVLYSENNVELKLTTTTQIIENFQHKPYSQNLTFRRQALTINDFQ